MRYRWLVFSFALFLLLTLPVFAAEDDHWDNQFAGPGADGTLLTVVANGSDVYVGGLFSVVGEARSQNIARWDGTSWLSLGGGVSGGIGVTYAIAPRGPDVYVGGNFTNAGGIRVTNLARWNGTRWSDVGGGINGVIVSLLFVGNDLYAGGIFTRAGNVNATNIARWDGTNWWPLGDGLSNTNGDYATVAAMAVNANGDLLAGGAFRFAGSLEVNGVARWDGNQWHDFAGGVRGGSAPTVNDVEVRGTDIYVAGAFQLAGGINATNIARWDGNQWNAMGGGPSGSFVSLAFLGNDLYGAGGFTNIYGSRILYVARWDGAAWQPLAPGAAGEVSTSVNSLAVGGETLYAAGNFVRAGNAGVLGVAKWDGLEWSALNGPHTKGLFLGSRTLAVAGTNLLVGGSFTVAGGVSAGRIASWNGAEWDSLGGGIVGGGSVSAIIEQGGLVYVGGSFTNMGGVAARNVAMWDGVNWFPLASGLNSNVTALTFHAGQLYAGGTFNRRGDGTGLFAGVALWDGSDWIPLAGVTAARINNSISALSSDGVSLYVGGNFLIGWFDGSATNVARWDGFSWYALGPGLNVNVSSLAVGNGEVYAGGTFTNSGTQLLKRIAKWDGAAWAPLGEGFDSGGVSAIAVSDSAIYVGGSFTNSRGTSLSRIAKWDGAQWVPLGSGVARQPGSPSISAVAIAGDDVYIAGNFTEAGGKPSSYIGRWNEKRVFGSPLPIRLVNTRWLGQGQFTFEVSGFRSGSYTVDVSTNLSKWTEIYSGDVGTTNVIDSNARNDQRYYRVRQP